VCTGKGTKDSWGIRWLWGVSPLKLIDRTEPAPASSDAASHIDSGAVDAVSRHLDKHGGPTQGALNKGLRHEQVSIIDSMIFISMLHAFLISITTYDTQSLTEA
jgi:hypothetical protein